ncbi:MAG: sensor protein [Gemmatimonadetes bacterium]|nr:sensor protein [Gemmatimonadota bacterium]
MRPEGSRTMNEGKHLSQARSAASPDTHQALAARLRAQFDALPNPLYTWEQRDDGELVLVDCNAAAHRASHDTLRDILGCAASELSSITPDIVERMHLALLSSEPIRDERSYTYRSGETRRIRLTYQRAAPGLLLVQSEDMEERAAGNELAAQGERRYRALIEDASDPISIVSADGTLLYASPAYRSVYGYLPEEVIGLSAFARVHGDDQPATIAAFERLLREPGKSQQVEFRYRHRDGSWVDSMAVGRNLLEDPAVRGIVITSRVLTEQKRAERELRASEARYRSLIEGAHEGIWALDAVGVTTYANPRLATYLGFTPEELVGQSIFMFVAPEESFEIRNNFARQQRGIAERVERRFIRRDGSELWTLMSWSALRGPSGEVTGTLALVSDITERRRTELALRESEARYRQVVELSPEPIVVHVDGVVLYANPSAARAFGAESTQAFVGVNMLALSSHEHHDEIAQRLRSLREEKQNTSWMFQRFRRLDGGSLEIEVSSVPFEFEGRTAVLSVARDVTAERRLTSSLQQAQKMEAVGRLAGGVAHDFNNLLTAILGNLEIAQPELPPGSVAAQDIAEAMRAASRAGDLTRQLLTFSRQQVVRKSVIDLNTVVAGTRALLSRLLGGHIEIRETLAPHSMPVYADSAQLETMVMNLAINARDAMRRGGVLSIRTCEVLLEPGGGAGSLAPGRYVGLEVNDTGEGMDQGTLTQIFEPFFTTKEAGQGTGLGLATVYGIVQDCGGSITVESMPQLGSTFRILLPEAEGAVQVAAPSAPVTGVVPTAWETILLVEDEPAVRMLAARALRAAGYTVVAAEDGERAYALVQDGARPDLVVTDAFMPKMNGPDLAAALRRRDPALLVLFMSGFTDNEVLRSGVLSPRDAFLQKPFVGTELVAAVREILSRGK